MEFIYVMINSTEWEDLVMYLTEYEAIEASRKHPHIRFEIFSCKSSTSGYHPTYNYIQNGKFCLNSQ
jgi:hypothetical protein